MLLSLSHWLQGLSPELGFFRVFQYLTLRAVMAALTALLIGLIAGPFVIRRLVALKIDVSSSSILKSAKLSSSAPRSLRSGIRCARPWCSMK